MNPVFLMIGFVIFLQLTAAGIYQMFRSDPASFFRRNTAPAADTLTDVKGWNRAHGMIWLGYGMTVQVSFILAAVLQNGFVIWVILGGIILPLPAASIIHRRLLVIYQKRPEHGNASSRKM